MDCVGSINESWQEISESTLNCCWSKLLPQYVPTTDVGSTCAREQVIRTVVSLTRNVSAPGFVDVDEEDILEVVMPQNEPLTAEEAEEILLLDIEEKTSDENVEIAHSQKCFHSQSLKKIINLLQEAVDVAVNEDPIMTRSLHFKHNCALAIAVYEDLFKDFQKTIKQSHITDFFS